MVEERKPAPKATRHSVVLEKRESCAVSGVLDVISFDEDTVVSETELGILIIHGSNLHVNRLNLETGDLSVDGEITGVDYDDQPGRGGKTSVWGKLFR